MLYYDNVLKWFILLTGANVRIDSTLVGFDQMSWQRGKQSFIFKGESKLRFNVVQNTPIDKNFYFIWHY